MILTARQQDAITEVINIAFGRTAAALSQLTGQRVALEVPQIYVHPIQDLAPALASMIDSDLATVHQIFTGQMAGDALLLLSQDGARLLVELLTGEGQQRVLDASAREVLTEVGNILLNACLGVFGDLLQVRITFSVPRLELEALDGLLKSLVIGQEELRYAMVVYTTFRLRDSLVGGYLLLVLGVNSFDRLLQSIETLE
jgi:chemotaxis protein CheC